MFKCTLTCNMSCAGGSCALPDSSRASSCPCSWNSGKLLLSSPQLPDNLPSHQRQLHTQSEMAQHHNSSEPSHNGMQRYITWHSSSLTCIICCTEGSCALPDSSQCQQLPLQLAILALRQTVPSSPQLPDELSTHQQQPHMQYRWYRNHCWPVQMQCQATLQKHVISWLTCIIC